MFHQEQVCTTSFTWDTKKASSILSPLLLNSLGNTCARPTQMSLPSVAHPPIPSQPKRCSPRCVLMCLLRTVCLLLWTLCPDVKCLCMFTYYRVVSVVHVCMDVVFQHVTINVFIFSALPCLLLPNALLW